MVPFASRIRLPRVLGRVVVGFVVAAFAGIFALAGSDQALADRFDPVGGGWERYVNERFGTSLEFPADLFIPDEAPANGDGRRLLADDATLEIYTWENVDGENAATLKRRLVGTQGYENVTYSPSGNSWLVISGFRGDNIFYEKYFFQNGMVSGFGMEFPESAKPRYAPIVERVENSFQAGRPD